MSIDRKISKFTPYQEPAGDRVPDKEMGVSYPVRTQTDYDGPDSRYFGEVKQTGAPDLNSHNNYNGRRQSHMELQSEGQFCVLRTDVDEDIYLSLDQALCWRLVVTGDCTIYLVANLWPIEQFERYSGSDGAEGVDLAGTIIIQNQGDNTVTIPADMYAPKGVAPTINKSGNYEIAYAVNLVPGLRPLIRLYPAIKPAGA
jgi:hypothetical protein